MSYYTDGLNDVQSNPNTWHINLSHMYMTYTNDYQSLTLKEKPEQLMHIKLI